MTHFSYDANGNQIITMESIGLTDDGRIVTGETTITLPEGEWLGGENQ